MTAKQRRFVAEYLTSLNATRAAIRAGYSEKTARQLGAENLSKPVIRAAIDAALHAKDGQAEELRARVLAGLLQIATFDPRQLFDHPSVEIRVADDVLQVQ